MARQHNTLCIAAKSRGLLNDKPERLGAILNKAGVGYLRRESIIRNRDQITQIIKSSRNESIVKP